MADFDYRRMTSMTTSEFLPCGSITYEDLEPALVRNFSAAGVPIATTRSAVKSEGFLAKKDPCLVIYNPDNLEYHTIIIVIRDAGGGRMFSLYSGGSAEAMHIGGGLLNVEHQVNKVKRKFVSKKQKQAEEEAYDRAAYRCVIRTLNSMGVLID